MRHRLVCLLSVAFLSFSVAFGQRAGNRSVSKSKTLQPTEQEILREQMVNSTRRIMFVDSIVVAKSHFLKAYNLSSEAGRVLSCDSIFKGQREKNALLHLNELGNKCYFSQKDASNQSWLYTSDLLGGKWSAPKKLNISQSHELINLSYPFMMPDGSTLYFAAQGKESLGGYDIFVTRYSGATGNYLKAENVGMPFNSEANDYMLAIDEADSIGYFATDRRQSPDSVCIYTFTITDNHQTYSPEEYTPDEIRSFASIHRIADTWDDSAHVRQIMLKLHQRKSPLANSSKKPGTMRYSLESKEISPFIVNDSVTYHHYSDFRSPASYELYKKVCSQRRQQQLLMDKIAKARERLLSLDGVAKDNLKDEISRDEALVAQLERQIYTDEKTIRNTENLLIKNE